MGVAVLLGVGLWALAFGRTTSDGYATWQDRSDWVERHHLPHATLAPHPAGAPLDSSLVFSIWTRSRVYLGPRTRTVHLVARVPPDSLDVWWQTTSGWVGDTFVPAPLAPNPSPETEWLRTLPPGPPTDGLTEWYGSRRTAVGLDRARGVVAYRWSRHDTHRRPRWWWPVWGY